ncbi:MarR family winged helix-turn-helix transcriptional regulator [Paracoccus tegillarcae]|uniref:MarR family transcriptional regulator n=1 Tax=Paracoccus tegillarcae TaxID=1529068 RepID=A0A2K9EMC4_9RHOB|nr:MarR family transcriptional regulator [Paracoccus tegillarcae]AUH34587.1 MarR family transcriptional regulator [Paracoccus tegillarcae]
MQLDEFFPYRLAVASETFSRNLADVYVNEFGLNREEWRLLFLLARAGRLTSSDLARRTTLDKVQVSRASQRLEKKRLITRDVPIQDRRLREYTCTEAGKRLFDKALPRVRARAEEMLSHLSTADRAALQQGVAALAVALGKGQAAEAEDTDG